MKLEFKKWVEMCGTGAVYDPKAKGEFNWWGCPGGKINYGKSVQASPIKNWTKKKSKP